MKGKLTKSCWGSLKKLGLMINLIITVQCAIHTRKFFQNSVSCDFKIVFLVTSEAGFSRHGESCFFSPAQKIGMHRP